jgi:hypothetical protein
MGMAPHRIAAVNALRRRLRLMTWFALFAIGNLSLAPTLAHALKAQQPTNPWAEICSAAAASRTASGHPAAPASHDSGLHAEHCPLCSHQGAGPALASRDALAWQAVEGVDLLVAWATPSPHRLLAWVVVRARAPPRSS